MKVTCVQCKVEWDLDMDPPACNDLEHDWTLEAEDELKPVWERG